MYRVADAPWPPMIDGPPDQILESNDGSMLIVPPSDLPPLLEHGSLDTWRWVRVDYRMLQSLPEDRGVEIAQELSVCEVLETVGDEHAGFLRERTQRAIEYLEDVFGPYADRQGDHHDERSLRALGQEAQVAAQRLRVELLEARL